MGYKNVTIPMIFVLLCLNLRIFNDVTYSNVMYSYSTNDDFNNLLIEMKAKKRRAEERKGKPPYRFVYCNEERMEQFEKEMRKKD